MGGAEARAVAVMEWETPGFEGFGCAPEVSVCVARQEN
jgi:hypothetical protein